MYKISFKHGYMILDPENEKMIFRSEKGVGDLEPLNLVVDKFIMNIHNWYLTVYNILRNRFNYKAEFRLPDEDFHMELEPFGVQGEGSLKVIHEKKKQGYIFRVRKDNLYVLKSILEDMDKTIFIGDYFLSKKKNQTTISGVILPYQVKKSLRFWIKVYLDDRKNFRTYVFSWEAGKVVFDRKHLYVFENVLDKYIPAFETSTYPDSLIKILLVL